jgi:chromosome segregation ATPase
MVPPPKGPVVVTNPDPTLAVQEALKLAVQTINDKFETAKEAVTLAREEMVLKLDALFAGVNDRFAGNKELVDQLGKANATALQAALENQKELLTQLKVTFDGTIAGVNEKIDGVNEKIDRLTSRLDTGEGRGIGVDNSRVTYREDVRDTRSVVSDTRHTILSMISAAIAAGALLALMLEALRK